ncbi:MAG: NAD(P)-binding domain-containing protein [Phyllobacterium sp.]|uniref:NAD(P)-binding domain-containing protein n=1 Tax=Phyllobacterium sp. TaxID=1871046 RepID=UPI0030F10640
MARKLAASGHEVKLANSKGPDTVRDLARDIGATAVSKQEAAQDVVGIVLSIPVRKVLRSRQPLQRVPNP